MIRCERRGQSDKRQNGAGEGFEMKRVGEIVRGLSF